MGVVSTGEGLPGRAYRSESDGQSQASNLLVVLAALLIARLVALALNRTELFFDEAQYWSWSLTPDFGYYSKPPLIAWIIAGTTSICGHSEACIRTASPILHTVTAWLVYLCGVRLHGQRVGFWSGIAFATVPGVSFSAGLISTDVPLLTCWAGALLAFVCLLQADDRDWRPAIGLGLSIGLGLNAKYAMAYFVVCALLFLLTTPSRRHLLRDARLLAALAIAVALIVPNIVWNAQHSFATLGHTADNANWGRSLFHPAKMAEFFLAQFGVFGPVYFAVLIWVAYRALRESLPEADRLLLWLSIPIIAIITVQAFLSRAHANWAACAYVSATVLVVAQLLRAGSVSSWLKGSVAVHMAVAAVLAVGLATAGSWRLPFGADPVGRLMGWRDLGTAVAKELEQARLSQRPYRAVVTDERMLTASLLYYMRAEPTPVLAWRQPGAKPRDHFELMREYRSSAGSPVLLVSLNPAASGIPGSFTSAKPLPSIVVKGSDKKGGTRTHYLFELSGPKAP